MCNNIIDFILEIGKNDEEIYLQRNVNGYREINSIFQIRNGSSTLNQRSFHSVIWKEEYISENIISEVFDSAISFNFGGCYMALYMDFLQNNYIVSHIHTGSNDQKEKWKQHLINNNCNNICLFKPYSYYNDIKKLTQIYGNPINTWGVIDKQGGCYTINVTQSERSYILENTSLPYKVVRVIQHLGNHSYYRPNDINWREDNHFKVLYLR
ncbi:hypothetical protein SFC43_05435 [Bacteroides sp. CR5/BHMF/2]|nr:hypothetical protein [Bacteroides sp. CR5/BHMF/2]